MGRASLVRRAILLAIAVLCLQGVCLALEFRHGVFSGLLPWDDCLILLRQLYNLKILGGADSLPDLIRRIGLVIVHSPISDLPTLAGLALSRGATWGPYAFNGLVVTAGLLVALMRTGRTPWLLFLALAAVILGQPMTRYAVTLLKADWKAGVLMACAVFTLHAASTRGDRRLQLWGAGLLGLAVAAKLTAFYGPLFAIATLAAFEILAFAARRAEGPITPGEYVAQARPVLSKAVALAVGPYIAFYLWGVWGVWGAHGLQGYIAFALSDLWNDGMVPLQRAASYAPFSSNPAWGSLSWQLLIFGSGALVLAWRRGDRLLLLALAIFLGLALMQLAPLTVAQTSNPEFGAVLVGVVLGAVLVCVQALATAFPRAATGVALILGLAIPTARALPLYTPEQTPTQAELKGLQQTYRRLVADAAARSPTGRPTMLVTFEHLFAPFPNLSLLYYERTRRLMDVDRLDQTDAAALARLVKAEFVVTLMPANGPVHGLVTRFYSSRDPAAADRWVAAQPRFARVGAYAIPGSELRLYQAIGR